ncbi:MAG: hypothetical protein IAE87_15465 [Rhodobacteraceae bacterium]|jgi:hypothetical protein|nr:hypothetical protein [Paracoccaceae bacterium]
MAVTTDILQTWRRPATVIRRKLDAGATEADALATLMGAAFLLFVARWPALAREAQQTAMAGLPADQAPGLQPLIGINLFAILFVAPLIFYMVAALAYAAMHLFGSHITPLAARLSLFWALMAISPAVLLHGLLAGLKGPGPALTLVGWLVLAAFLWLWVQLAREAAR